MYYLFFAENNFEIILLQQYIMMHTIDKGNTIIICQVLLQVQAVRRVFLIFFFFICFFLFLLATSADQ